MFRRARVRLTVLYIALFALVLAAFSIVFYVGFATVLAPSFDIGPELTNEQAAEMAYSATIQRIGLALIAANIAVVVVVGVSAWILSALTLRQIRDAHLRQRRFVADASHEIRTPLAAIRAIADEASTADASPDELRAALARIVTSASDLSRLTSDLLVLVRADEEPAGPRRETFDLSVLVAEGIATFSAARPEASRPTLALATDLLVAADPDEIRRVVLNLLDNAVRYGGASPIRVRTLGTEREAMVEVQDDGPGIAAIDLERLFHPFFRVHPDATSPDGSGLGLAIARGLAQRNRGRLTATSQVGAGSTFRLALPRFR